MLRLGPSMFVADLKSRRPEYPQSRQILLAAWQHPIEFMPHFPLTGLPSNQFLFDDRPEPHKCVCRRRTLAWGFNHRVVNEPKFATAERRQHYRHHRRLCGPTHDDRSQRGKNAHPKELDRHMVSINTTWIKFRED